MRPRLLILSGPTREFIDPVRFIGNASSGLMGKAIAEEARARCFQVDFVSGPVAAANLPELEGAGATHHVISAADMLARARSLFATADAVVFAAAVADYAPAEMKSGKMAKSKEGLTLELRATPDIAKTLCAEKRADQIAIGFALQTSDGEANARRKLESKNLDGIVLNTPASLGVDTGSFSYLSRAMDHFNSWGTIDKTACARNILRALDDLRRA